MGYRKYGIIILLTTLSAQGWRAAAMAAPAYSVDDLGTLGGSSSLARSINARRQIVGYSQTAGNKATHAFFWQDGHMTDLDTLGGSVSAAYSVNNIGQVVGFSYLAGDAAYHAFLWQSGALRDLGTLGGANSTANSVNDAEQVAGTSFIAGNAAFHAFLFDAAQLATVQQVGPRLRDLGTLGGPDSHGLGINSSGQVTGDALLGQSGPFGAYLFDDCREMLGLASPADHPYGIGYSVNSSGEVAGVVLTGASVASAASPSGPHQAFRWRNGTATGLGGLPGYANSIAYGSNDTGQIVGVATNSSDFLIEALGHAFVYTDGTGMVDLNSLIDPALGWQLESAHAITDRGEIVGTGIHHGQRHAFRLVPLARLTLPARVSLGYLETGNVSGAHIAVAVLVHSGAVPLGGYEFAISFDPAVLSLEGVNPGSSPEFLNLNVTYGAKGTLTLSGSNTTSRYIPTGSNHVATLDFLITGKAGDFTDVSPAVINLYDTSLTPLPFDIESIPVFVDGDQASPGIARAPGRPQANIAENATWTDIEAKFNTEKAKWQPTIDQINEKLKEYNDPKIKDDPVKRKAIGDAIRKLVADLSKVAIPFLKENLKKLVVGDPKLTDLTKAFFTQIPVNFNAFMAETQLGLTHKEANAIKNPDGTTKVTGPTEISLIEFNIAAFSDAARFFGTGFHEALHATKGSFNKDRPLLKEAEELWVREQEDKFYKSLGICGNQAGNNTDSHEAEYTYYWKIDHKLLTSDYKATATGKKLADCFYEKMKDTPYGKGWQQRPEDAYLIAGYNLWKWKAMGTMHAAKIRTGKTNPDGTDKLEDAPFVVVKKASTPPTSDYKASDFAACDKE